MPLFVYILRCSDHTLYVGSTSDVDWRMEYHNSGRGCTYTSKRLPVELVYSEEFTSLKSAIAREKQLKRWTHAKKAALVAGDTTLLKSLSRRRQR